MVPMSMAATRCAAARRPAAAPCRPARASVVGAPERRPAGAGSGSQACCRAASGAALAAAPSQPDSAASSAAV